MDQPSSNPFEDESGVYRVLANEAGEHSLWPDAVAVPRGWDTVFGPDARAACLGYVEEHWTALAPAGSPGRDGRS
ncbi:MbtH family protein [Streptomyces sp. NPDC053755]|uniref:MbtH family protein n=1 Tax=Streptomyces sp. NPDC053755 TaxID=3155815 RepID=UPI003429C823